jgi:hypothetical protein
MEKKTTLWRNNRFISWFFGGFILIVVAMNGYFLDTNDFPIPAWVALGTLGYLLFFARHEIYLDHEKNELVRRLRCFYLIKEQRIPVEAIEYIELSQDKLQPRKKGAVNLIFANGKQFNLSGTSPLYKASKIARQLGELTGKPVKSFN